MCPNDSVYIIQIHIFPISFSLYSRLSNICVCVCVTSAPVYWFHSLVLHRKLFYFPHLNPFITDRCSIFHSANIAALNRPSQLNNNHTYKQSLQFPDYTTKYHNRSNYICFGNQHNIQNFLHTTHIHNTTHIGKTGRMREIPDIVDL